MRIVWRILLVVLALVLGLPSLLIGWLAVDQPRWKGRIAIPNLTAPVTIGFDNDAIPHLRAANEADSYRALGWLHARDRLWQMETQRRLGQGRLAEVVGQPALGFDRLMRALDLYRLAEASYATLEPEARAALDAYTEGVNAWITRPDGALPIEFQLLLHRPEPWRPADSLVWGKLMALMLTGNYQVELLRAELAAKLTPKQIDDLFPPVPPLPATLPDAGGSRADLGPTVPAPSRAADIAGVDWMRFAAALPPPIGPSTASNEWVLAGTRTATGSPILANDPHLGLGAPILWYLARIETPEGIRAGATVPGVPFLVLGRNSRIAWGATTTGTDAQDLFVETVDPANPANYLTPQGSVPFQVREERIRVRFGSEQVLKIRSTRHGPVLSDIDERMAKGGRVVALAFTALDPADTTAGALYRIAKANDCMDFREAMRLWKAPQQNFTCADSDGHIGLIAPGAVPVRKSVPTGLPADGASGNSDWIGMIPFEQLPQAIDPPSGLLINANNAVVGPNYPHLITQRWEDQPYRAERIAEVLAAQPRHRVADSVRLQVDDLSPETKRLLPMVIAAKPKTPLGEQARSMLQGWDGTMRRDLPEPLIWVTWMARMQRLLYADELGELAPRVGGFRPATIERMLTVAPEWCDQISTAETETCPELIAKSLDLAVADLAKAYGKVPSAWRWGDAHHAPLAHALFGTMPLIRHLFEIGTEVDGGDFTVHRTASGGPRDAGTPTGAIRFDAVHGAGYRAVYDLSDLEQSRMVLATGQSGNPLSRHYGDFVRRWKKGETVTLAGSPEQAAGPRGLLQLVP